MPARDAGMPGRASPSGPAVPWTALAGSVAAVVLTAAVLHAMGRPLICPCGTVKLWHGSANSSETSQHLSDPYTFSHVIHGVLFYALIRLAGHRRRAGFTFGQGLLIATALESAWEIFENSPAIIGRYRAATIALGYQGDSVLNSVSDILAMMTGFATAAGLPPVASIGIVLLIEGGLAYLIRDNLSLNIIMLMHPFEAIRAWQQGA